MRTYISSLLISLVLMGSAAPALADDCLGAVKTATMSMTKRPFSSISTRIDAKGKQTVLRQVQTELSKYVEMPTGGWVEMPIGLKDLDDSTDSIKTCSRIGSDTVSGEPVVVYQIHMDGDLMTGDGKLWISTRNSLILKAESTVEGAHSTTLYDFSHVTPPANAKKMGTG